MTATDNHDELCKRLEARVVTCCVCNGSGMEYDETCGEGGVMVAATPCQAIRRAVERRDATAPLWMRVPIEDGIAEHRAHQARIIARRRAAWARFGAVVSSITVLVAAFWIALP